jgi:predicted permease
VDERPESERPEDERRGSELFGLPAMIFLLAVVAVVKGMVTGNLGFTIVGLVAAVGVLFAIGLAMTLAKRE